MKYMKIKYTGKKQKKPMHWSFNIPKTYKGNAISVDLHW